MQTLIALTIGVLLGATIATYVPQDAKPKVYAPSIKRKPLIP